MLNPATETIRIDREYMPLLLQLKATQATRVDDSTQEAIAALEAADVLRRGRLHPMADAILGLVADPGLVISVERLRAGTVATATIWATPGAAAVGTRVDGGLYELRLANPALLPFHLFQMVHLQPRPEDSCFVHELPAEVMFAAEAAIHDGDIGRAAQLISGAAVRSPEDVVAILTGRVASWRVHSIWSTANGPVTAAAYGMDCGRLGNVLVDVDPAGPSLRLRSAGFAEVTDALRATLPRNS
jgi:hypothetical protein